MSGGELGEVLHEIPHTAFSDDTLGHAIWPPAFFVELWKLDPLGEPDGQVIVQGATPLKFSHPDITEGHALPSAPLANCL